MSGEPMPKIMEPQEGDKSVDPIMKADAELKSKYPGLKPKVRSVAQRKISSGGVQYFDSGDYNMSGSSSGVASKDKTANPKPLPAHLQRMRGGGRGGPHMAGKAPSGLSSGLAMSNATPRQ